MPGQKSTSSNTLSTKWAEQHLHAAPANAVGIHHGKHFALPGGVSTPPRALTGSSKQPRSLPGSAVSSAPCEYSRYQDRYLNQSKSELSSASFVQNPAASWIPYVIYGGIASLIILVWFAWVLTIKDGSLMNNPLAFNIGLGILAVIAIAAIVTGFVTAGLSVARNADECSSDLYAAAFGKTAAMLACALLVWIICMTIVSA